jgi:hypothetical protein
MPDRAVAIGTSGDLFDGVVPGQVHKRIAVRRMPSELRVARALCAQLRAPQAEPEKQRITHLICLNLISMLRHGARP